MPNQPIASPPAPPATSLWDFWSGLLWPRVLGGAVYGLRPGRLGLAFFAIIIIALLLALGVGIDNAIRSAPATPETQAPEVTREVSPGTPPQLQPAEPEATETRPAAPLVAPKAEEPWHIPWISFVDYPLVLLTHFPITTLVFGPLILVTLLLMLGAISRIAACELALDRQISWWEGLSYAAKFWKSLLGATLGPIVGVWFIALLLALFGLILLRWPVVNILGAILFPIVLILAFLAAAIALMYLLGSWLITPAVMADGADAIDAIQRAYAYVIDRPVRLIIYILLALIGLVIVIFLAATFIFATVYFAGQASAIWAGDSGRDMIWRAIYTASPDDQPLASNPAIAPQRTYSTGAAIIRFWTAIPILFIAATALSGLAAAATMVYLAMRRLCDGQDISEIWWPGRVEEAMAASMDARAAASAE